MFFIELEPVFNNEGLTKPLDFSLDMSFVDYNGGFPFKSPVCIRGEVKNSTGVVSISATAEFTLDLSCDRCAADFSRKFSVPCEHVLVTEVNDESNDELIVIDSLHYDLEPLITEDIILSLPSKVLCRKDCLGICCRCGKNLNDGPCDCEKNYDPRWDALSKLLEDE